MCRPLIALLTCSMAFLMYACSGAQPAPTPASDDTCPVLDPGPPPVCPKDCTWDIPTKTCRKDQGVIMPNNQPRPDGGTTK
jgi:hypothetical protein